MSAPGWPARLRSPAALALLGSFAAVAAVFHRLLFTTDQLYFRDSIRMSLPMRLFTASEFAEGRWPLWFPWEAGGLPFVGQLATGVFHPLNALYALLPFGRAYQLNYLAAYLLAAGGMFLWARGRGLSPSAAALGAVGFSLSGSMASQSNLQYLVGNASVPIALFGAEAFLRRPTAYRGWLGAAGLSLPLLAGEPQSLVMAAVLLVLDALARPTWPERRRALGLLLVPGLGAAVVGAIQLVPAAQAFASSARFEGVDRNFWSVKPLRLLELILPNAFNEGTPHESFDALVGTFPWAPRLFLGPVLLALAAMGAKLREGRGVAVFAALALWLSFGPAAGLDLLFAAVVPLWDGFRYPEKMLAFFSLAAALLAGLGLDALGRRTARSVVGAAAAVTLFVAAAAPVLARAAPEPYGGFFELLVGRSALMAIVTTAAFCAVLWHERGPRAATAAVLALACGPVVLGALSAPKYAPIEKVFARPWTAEAILDDSRADVTPPRIESVNGMGELPPDADPVLGLHVLARDELTSEFNVLYGIENFMAYLPATDSVHHFATTQVGRMFPLRLLPIYSVGYMVVTGDAYKPPAPRWKLFAEKPEHSQHVFKAQERLGRALIARSAVRVDSGVDAVKTLVDPKFHPGDAITVDCDVTPEDAQVADRGEARITAWDPQNVTVATTVRRDAFLLVNDTIAPGWRAWVDGEEAPVCRGNGLMRAVRVRAGAREVRMSYEPGAFSLGYALTLGGSALWLFVGLVADRKRRLRAEAVAPPRAEGPA